METKKPPRKAPPKIFSTIKEAKEALANLADSLSTHSFPWPAAALRSYLKGTCKSLDEAFGLPTRVATPEAARTPEPAKKNAGKKDATKKDVVKKDAVKKKAAQPVSQSRPAPRRKRA